MRQKTQTFPDMLKALFPVAFGGGKRHPVLSSKFGPLKMSANGTTRFDFMLVGSSLQAALIAGLLAREHSQKVCLIVDPSTEHRLAQEISLSVDCITRPETWRMLAQSRTEVLKLLTCIGGGEALRRVNPLIVATDDVCAEALAHMFHVARGSGYEVEQVPLSGLSTAIAALRMRGARVIQRKMFLPALARWLVSNGVRVVDQNSLELNIRRSGEALTRSVDETIRARRLVLADEGALLAHTKPEHLDPIFAEVGATTLLSEPIPSLSEVCVLNPADQFGAYGLMNNSFEIIAHLPHDEIASAVVTSLPDGRKLRPAGQAVFDTCISADGAPVIGKLGQSGAWVVGGFGRFGAFVAPAIARFLTGKAKGLEEEYFSRRGAGAARKSANVADFQHSGSGR